MLANIREIAKNKPACIVFDNFEQILSNQEIVKQISDCIILLDDEDYSKYRVKLCLVWVPSNIKEYVAGRGHYDTISNRMIELPEVARLTKEQATQLLTRGFEQELGLHIEDPETCYESIMWRTDRIAQHLHEYGLEVAQLASATGVVNLDVVDRAGNNWLTGSIESARSVIENRLNARETKAGRRNQTIYALGISKAEEFRYSDIEEIVRQEFPTTTSSVQPNIAGILTELSTGDNPPIKRVPKGDAYRFINPKYRMAIRTMLRKAENETVEKIVQPK